MLSGNKLEDFVISREITRQQVFKNCALGTPRESQNIRPGLDGVLVGKFIHIAIPLDV